MKVQLVLLLSLAAVAVSFPRAHSRGRFHAALQESGGKYQASHLSFDGRKLLNNDELTRKGSSESDESSSEESKESGSKESKESGSKESKESSSEEGDEFDPNGGILIPTTENNVRETEGVNEGPETTESSAGIDVTDGTTRWQTTPRPSTTAITTENGIGTETIVYDDSTTGWETTTGTITDKTTENAAGTETTPVFGIPFSVATTDAPFIGTETFSTTRTTIQTTTFGTTPDDGEYIDENDGSDDDDGCGCIGDEDGDRENSDESDESDEREGNGCGCRGKGGKGGNGGVKLVNVDIDLTVYAPC